MWSATETQAEGEIAVFLRVAPYQAGGKRFHSKVSLAYCSLNSEKLFTCTYVNGIEPNFRLFKAQGEDNSSVVY
jgi:hypothetical protein